LRRAIDNACALLFIIVCAFITPKCEAQTRSFLRGRDKNPTGDWKIEFASGVTEGYGKMSFIKLETRAGRNTRKL